MSTVLIRLIGSDLGNSMSAMRVWLDDRKISPNSFRQSGCLGGVALHIDFDLRADASAFARQFGGHVLGLPLPERTAFSDPIC